MKPVGSPEAIKNAEPVSVRNIANVGEEDDSPS